MELIFLASFLGIIIALIGFIVQFVRKRPSKHKWGIACIICFLLMIVSFILVPTTPTETTVTNKGEYDGCSVELLDAKVITNDNGRFLKVNAIYVNSKSDPQYASSAFAVRAFQNDVELEDWSFSQDNTGNLTHEVRNGASVNISYLFMLTDNSEVEVLIGTPTHDMQTIGKQIYLKAEE